MANYCRYGAGLAFGITWTFLGCSSGGASADPPDGSTAAADATRSPVATPEGGPIASKVGADAAGTAVSKDASSPFTSSDTGAEAGRADAGSLSAPTGLLTDLLAHPENTVLTDPTPRFGWIVNANGVDVLQVAYRILVSSSMTALDANTGDAWDTGKVASAESINVLYAGMPLSAGGTYFWKVQTWDSTGILSDWSAPQTFVMASSLGTYATATDPVVQTHIAPAEVSMVGAGHYFVDFGLDAFGRVELTLDAPSAGAVVDVYIGEKAAGQSVDLNPGATIRYAKSSVTLVQGTHTYRVSTPKDSVNTSPPAIALPASLGVVMPFRYVEILNSPVVIGTDAVSQVAIAYPFDASSSSFSSSNATLDSVWNLAKYTMLATTFAGIYVDGDRERTPYEGDAYIHQRGHYSVDREFALARHSHEYLLDHPTWPTEWKQHSIMIAWADWMYTGNVDSLAQAYDVLASQKLLTQYIGTDGLLNTESLDCSSSSCGPLVDWPANERDGFVMTDVNTVVNAFYCRNLQQMADIATALGKTADAARYAAMATAAIATFNQKLFDSSTGLYVDGETTTHSSLHANMFPLALGIVPAERAAAVTAFVESRGMACSVYGAQYLLEALYEMGEADAAVSLMTASTLASWTNMMKVGSTMTMEAWDVSIKSNLDWNHS